MRAHAGQRLAQGRARLPLVRALMVCTASVGAIGAMACADKGVTPPEGVTSQTINLQFMVTAPAQQQAAAIVPKYLLVAALYVRTRNDGDDLELLNAVQPDITSGAQRIVLPVNLARCLADKAHVGSKGQCAIVLAVALTYKKYDLESDDANPLGESFDARLFGPFETGPGRTPSLPAIDLSASRFGVIGWAGDDALRLGGDDTPVGLGALAGVPGAGGAAPTVFAPTVGLTFPADPRSSTAPQGPFPQLAILRNGSWSRVTATTLMGTQFFTDVTALSESEVYLAHRNGLFKYDGSAIGQVAAVNEEIVTVGSATVSSTSKYVIAGGNGGAVWIGDTQNWQKYVIPGAPRLDGGVCITGPNEAFASASNSGLWRFNGTAWTATSMPVAASSVKGNLQCPAPGKAFVQLNGLAGLSWNGTSWTLVPTSGIGAGRVGTWSVVSPTEIYLAADSSNFDRAFYRFNGTNWQEIGRTRFTGGGVGRPWADARGAAYFPSLGGRVERASSSVSVVSYQPSFRDVMMTSPTNAFVVGTNAFLARWDGVRWTVDAPPAPVQATREFSGVWTGGSSNGWAVGKNSTIVRFDGSKWSTVSDVTSPVAATDNFNAVWGNGNEVWVVGDNSIVHCSTQSGCANQSAPGSGALKGIWGSGRTNVFAVGVGGRIVRYDGSTWISMVSPGKQPLYKVGGSGPNNVWAVGDSALYRFDGTQWKDVTNAGDAEGLFERHQQSNAGIPNTLGLWVRAPNEVYITTPFDAIARFEGTRWDEIRDSDFGHRIMAISGAPEGCALAVTEGQFDNRAATLIRGFGPTGCFLSPMAPPLSWP